MGYKYHKENQKEVVIEKGYFVLVKSPVDLGVCKRIQYFLHTFLIKR